MTAAQPVTLEQLARLYQARNNANKRMSQALRARAGIAEAKAKASQLNRAYVDALKAHKRQQKAARRGEWRTTMIKFYLDYKEAAQE